LRRKSKSPQPSCCTRTASPDRREAFYSLLCSEGKKRGRRLAALDEGSEEQKKIVRTITNGFRPGVRGDLSERNCHEKKEREGKWSAIRAGQGRLEKRCRPPIKKGEQGGRKEKKKEWSRKAIIRRKGEKKKRVDWVRTCLSKKNRGRLARKGKKKRLICTFAKEKEKSSTLSPGREPEGGGKSELQ